MALLASVMLSPDADSTLLSRLCLAALDVRDTRVVDGRVKGHIFATTKRLYAPKESHTM